MSKKKWRSKGEKRTLTNISSGEGTIVVIILPKERKIMGCEVILHNRIISSKPPVAIIRSWLVVYNKILDKAKDNRSIHNNNEFIESSPPSSGGFCDCFSNKVIREVNSIIRLTNTIHPPLFATRDYIQM